MKINIIIIALILLPLVCMAEQYMLEDLVNVGLEKSFDIQQEVVNKQNSTSIFRSSIYNLFPTLNIGMDRRKYYDQILEPNETDWNDSGYLTVSKSFFLNDPSYYNIHTSINGMKSANSSMDEMKKQIAYYVFAKYLYVLELQETLDIQKKNLKLQNKIHQQIQVQYDTGNKSLLELKQSEVSLIDYEIAVNEAANSLSNARKDLFSYLNIDDEGYEFVEPGIEVNLEKQEFVNNNLLKQKLYSLKTNKLLHIQTTMDLLPTFSIGYSLAHNDPDDIYAYSDYTRDSQSLTLSASWNIFGIMDNVESIIRSKRNLKIQKMDYEKSKKDYNLQLVSLYDDLETLKRSFDLYDDKLKLAEENLNMAQEHFRMGMISLLDLDRSKIDFQNTQLAQIQNNYQLMKKQEEINLLISAKILGKW